MSISIAFIIVLKLQIILIVLKINFLNVFELFILPSFYILFVTNFFHTSSYEFSFLMKFQLSFLHDRQKRHFSLVFYCAHISFIIFISRPYFANNVLQPYLSSLFTTQQYRTPSINRPVVRPSTRANLRIFLSDVRAHA